MKKLLLFLGISTVCTSVLLVFSCGSPDILSLKDKDNNAYHVSTNTSYVSSIKNSTVQNLNTAGPSAMGGKHTIHTRLQNKGSYQDFLDAVRTFESSIDPKQASYYAQNYENPNAIRYQKVTSPGRVVRDNDGHPEMETTSIKRYFQKLGIDHLYTLGSTDPEMFRVMQYSVTNFLGFIGYQFSEQDLWDLGYYTHFDENNYPEYYSDVNVSLWANGRRDIVIFLGQGQDPGFFVHLTDVNTWKGTFTGKHGIYTMEDYKNPDKQDFIARDHFQFKYNNIVSGLAKHGKSVFDFVGTTLYWNQCVPPIVPPPGGRSNEVTVTVSGLLAGAHLRGAAGVVALLINHQNHADEIGTTILQYVQDYGNYNTPFGTSN